MDTKELIIGKLAEIAEKNYAENATNFKDKTHFLDSLEKCYCLIANRTCQKWNETNGIDHRMNKEDFLRDFRLLVYSLDNSYIHSDEFKGAFKSYWLKGKKRNVPYGVLLKMLSDGGIIHVNSSYSPGTAYGCEVCKHWTKSYRLDSCFMFEIIESYLNGKGKGEVFNIYDCFQAKYSNKLLEAEIEKAGILYRTMVEQAGISVRLPKDWETQISPFGYFHFNSKLTVKSLLQGMRSFQRHTRAKKNGGRFYDWFTSCPSAFRTCLWKDGKHYRELIDCHSGIFWMFALHGYSQGQIGREECQRIIDHCFKGTFYTDVSGEAKTKALKQVFMKVLNTTRNQERYIAKIVKDPLFKKIRLDLSRRYPQWTAYLDYLKNKHPRKIGKYNHYGTIKIEEQIMDELKHRLEALGYSDLRRVHDALYGLQDVKNIDAILYQVIMDYFNSIVSISISSSD